MAGLVLTVVRATDYALSALKNIVTGERTREVEGNRRRIKKGFNFWYSLDTVTLGNQGE
jgi:hypothetical protein